MSTHNIYFCGETRKKKHPDTLLSKDLSTHSKYPDQTVEGQANLDLWYWHMLGRQFSHCSSHWFLSYFFLKILQAFFCITMYFHGEMSFFFQYSVNLEYCLWSSGHEKTCFMSVNLNIPISLDVNVVWPVPTHNYWNEDIYTQPIKWYNS